MFKYLAIYAGLVLVCFGYSYFYTEYWHKHAETLIPRDYDKVGRRVELLANITIFLGVTFPVITILTYFADTYFYN